MPHASVALLVWLSEPQFFKSLLRVLFTMGFLSRGIVVFCLLVMQNASVVLVMRYTRATPGEGTYVATVLAGTVSMA